MIRFDRTLPVSPYAAISKFLTRFSCLLAAFFPLNRIYLLNDNPSVESSVVSVIAGLGFILTAWWGGRLWAKFNTMKYFSLQVVLLLFITFYLLTELISIPKQWHAPIVMGFLAILWFLAFQRGGEAHNGRRAPRE